MKLSEFIEQLNTWGQQHVPFLFMIDFEMQKPFAFRLDEINERIKYNFNGNKNYKEAGSNINVEVEKLPITIEEYSDKFNKVFSHLTIGDSYLTNLTIKTEIKISSSLLEIYNNINAKYKLLYFDEFLVFSPEIFVKIIDGKIFSYPMKGTIDASINDAERKILADKKELAEHVTIVDLIRNDLSQVATDVQVTRFRYIDKLKTNNKDLLQVSSEISGTLQPKYLENIGSLLIKLLPAGSISGAPKKKTVEIIGQAEGETRGYYTGIMGIFDGRNLDSGVMIRFIEITDGKFFYRSGGGITTQSVMKEEYQEAIDKIYVPLN